jgi:hypothetical protein
VRVKKDVSIRFSIVSMNNNKLNIEFGKSYFDFVKNQTPVIYSLDTSLFNLTENNKTLEIVFDIYSGYPDFQISFD